MKFIPETALDHLVLHIKANFKNRRAAARAWCLGESYLSAIVNGDRPIPPMLLEVIGWEWRLAPKAAPNPEASVRRLMQVAHAWADEPNHPEHGRSDTLEIELRKVLAGAKPSTLDERIARAAAEVAQWSPEKRASMQLQGGGGAGETIPGALAGSGEGQEGAPHG